MNNMSQNIRSTSFLMNLLNSPNINLSKNGLIINLNAQENISSEINNITEIAQQNIQQVGHSISVRNEKLASTPECKISDIDLQDGNGLTKLMYAIRLLDTKLAIYLIDKGADVNIKDTNGWTALNYAISYDNEVLFKKLIDLNADLGAANSRNCKWYTTFLEVITSPFEPYKIAVFIIKSHVNNILSNLVVLSDGEFDFFFRKCSANPIIIGNFINQLRLEQKTALYKEDLFKLLQRCSRKVIEEEPESNQIFPFSEDNKTLDWEKITRFFELYKKVEKELINILYPNFGDYICSLNREELAKLDYVNLRRWEHTQILGSKLFQAQKKSKFTDIDIVFQ